MQAVSRQNYEGFIMTFHHLRTNAHTYSLLLATNDITVNGIVITVSKVGLQGMSLTTKQGTFVYRQVFYCPFQQSHDNE